MGDLPSVKASDAAADLSAMLDRMSDELAAVRAQRDRLATEVRRLRVIVDLACHDHENLPTDLNVTGWFSVSQALCDAVAAEVARRAAL